MFVFRKIWRALFSWNTRFEIRPFALLPTKLEEENLVTIQCEASKACASLDIVTSQKKKKDSLLDKLSDNFSSLLLKRSAVVKI